MGHGRGPGGSSFLLLWAWRNFNQTNPTSNAKTAAATADENPDSLTVSISILAHGKEPPTSPSVNAILPRMQAPGGVEDLRKKLVFLALIKSADELAQYSHVQTYRLSNLIL